MEKVPDFKNNDLYLSEESLLGLLRAQLGGSTFHGGDDVLEDLQIFKTLEGSPN
jgi:hypothetical protein